MNQRPDDAGGMSRRSLLRLGAGGAALLGFTTVRGVVTPVLARQGLLSPDGILDAASAAISDKLYREDVPTSPLIAKPFIDELPVPKALAPVPRSEWTSWSNAPGPGNGQQNSLGTERHQLWCSQLGLPDPIVYELTLKTDTHVFTTSPVLPINALGQPTASFGPSGTRFPAGVQRTLPPSTIYGFNGQFPGPMINAQYGRPVLVRLVNDLATNEKGLDRQDFGSPDLRFLTHLHNGHTAPESDGNPHYAMLHLGGRTGYEPGQWVDNLYLGYPAGNDDREKQSFFWFHDHVMDHTGADVYKGMVGLFPIYDPKNNLDNGDERYGYRLPGVRTNRTDGAFDVRYDVPLVFCDVRLDDGVTVHQDAHDGSYPAARNPRTHPEWWGKSFYKHMPNHGFVGDILTVNGVAFPVTEVKRRKYRLRFLDASVSRIYEFALMSSTKGPKSAASLGLIGDELEGQYRIPDGEQCMRFTQIATDGGLLPAPITRNSFELWPAKRREVIVDFSKYQDGTPTTPGDVVYLTNIMKMPDGRMWTNSSRSIPDPAYKIPVLKFVIGQRVPDNSVISPSLRPLPPLPSGWRSMLDERTIFEVKRGSLGGEVEWLVNGEQFDPTNEITGLLNPAGRRPAARQRKNSFNLWELRNGGGGWVHPFHLHQEEHRTVMRNGRDVSVTPDKGHPDDTSREDLIALDPGESVIVYRGFRDFTGPYVAHCHNLVHEDHAMMFSWAITP